MDAQCDKPVGPAGPYMYLMALYSGCRLSWFPSHYGTRPPGFHPGTNEPARIRAAEGEDEAQCQRNGPVARTHRVGVDEAPQEGSGGCTGTEQRKAAGSGSGAASSTAKATRM